MASTQGVLARRFQFLTVLHNPNYRTYYIGLLTSVTGHQMLIATQAWLVYEITGSPLTLGLVGGFQAIPTIALSLFAGALADRLNPRYIIILAQSAMALLMGILATLVVTGSVEIWHIIAIAVLIGAAESFDQPARRAVWPRLIERHEYQYAVPLNSTVWSGTRIIAPAIAGFIIATAGSISGDDEVGAGVSFYFSFFGFLAMSLAMGFIRMRPAERARGATVLHDIGEGLLWVKRHPIFMLLLGMVLFNGFFGLSYMWLMPVFAEEYFKVDVKGYGLLMSASGIGGLAGVLTVASFGSSLNRSWILIGGAFLFGSTVITFAATSAVFGLFFLGLFLVLLGGFFTSMYQVSVGTTLNLLVPDEYRGRVMGLQSITWSLAPLGSLQAGALATLVNTPFAVILGGSAVILFAMVAATNRQVRSLRADIVESVPV